MDAQTDPALASTVLTHRESRLIVFGVLLPTFLGSLDNTVLATALPTIGRDFDNVRDLPWLITAYLIAATAVIPLYGKLADIHGRMFALRLALFLYIGASLVCALAPNMPVLICGRVLHGFGGGGLTSLGMIVLGDVAAPKERGRYYAYFSVVYTSAGACGPALGGFFSDYLHWSVIFWANIPLGIIALALTGTLLRKLPRYERPHRLDVIGAILIVVASVAFMLALNQGGTRYPWGSPPILGLLIAAALIGGLFVWRLLTAAEPLIPLAILATPEARLAIAANAFGWGSIIGLNIFLPMYLQSALGMSATQSGLSLMVLMVALNLSAGTSGQLLGRVKHYKLLPMLGLALALIAVFILGWRADRISSLEFEIVVALLGLGFGPLPPLCTTVVQNSVEMRHFGTAIGTMNFLRNLFTTMLVAVFGAIVLAAGSAVVPQAPETTSGMAATAFSRVFFAATVSLGIALVGLLLLREKPLHTNLPPVTR
jgi:EmrB/QacA subfamily drug resistance transporter